MARAGPGRDCCQCRRAQLPPRAPGDEPQPRGRAAAPLGQVSELAEQLEERLFQAYGVHNELIQQRLQALAEVMESVEEAQAEMRRICGAVEAAYRDLCLQPEA